MNLIEQQVLITATALNADTKQMQRLRHLISLVKDGDRLINTAAREGLACLLYKNLLKSGGLDYLTHKQQEKLKAIYYQTVVYNLRCIEDLKQILGPLNAMGVEVTLLQGIILLGEVYEDVGVRPMTDIDLWVQKRDLDKLIGIFHSLNYERDPLYPNIFWRGDTVFDIHTHILWADRITTRALLLKMDQAHIRDATVIKEFEGLTARGLNPYDQVLYLTLHGLKHNMEKLIWLVDIKNILSRWDDSDWPVLADRVRRLGQTRAVSYMLFTLRHRLDFTPPHGAQKVFERVNLNIIEKRMLRSSREKGPAGMLMVLQIFSPQIGLKKRFSFLFETIFPRPEVLRQVFMNSPHIKPWQLYVKRLVQLAGMVMALFRKT